MNKLYIPKKYQIFDFINSMADTTGKLSYDFGLILKLGLSAEYIAQKLQLDRSNTSRILNMLFREGKLIKLSGKPVLFFSKELLEKLLSIKFGKTIFASREELFSTTNENTFNNGPQNVPKLVPDAILSSNAKTDNNAGDEGDVFSNMIGYNTSLKEQVKQAIAAIIYPANGLHTLLLGASGTGKTTFARLMYQYAVDSGYLTKLSPYAVFNCADYSGNSQLLLSYLFGYRKGAFTGADKDRLGLIDKANNGILFLDEVHRLPPEGQEMLFPLIDHGYFRRLGETNNIHKANIRLILATTENPNASILRTFMRRIPCIITIPDLASRPFEDRLNLIYNFFAEETKKINIPITVPAEVIKFLSSYECKGNIGQLKNDIKVICAKALVEYITEHQDHIIIKLSQIIKYFINNEITTYNKYANLYKNPILGKLSDITFNPEDISKNQLFINSLISSSYQPEEDFYAALLKSSSTYFKQRLPIEVIKNNINTQVENYFDKYPYETSKNQIFSDESVLSSIIDINIIDIVKQILSEIMGKSNIRKNDKVIYSLSLHIETLLESLKNGITIRKAQLPYKLKSSDKYYNVTKKIKEKLETAFSIKIPEEEAFFITVFLDALKNNTIDSNNFIGVLVIAHGDTTASSMVDVANELLKTTHVRALNMPLHESVQNTIQKAIAIVKELHSPRGILILVDMGSLASFGEIIEKNTGISTKTLKMVTTPIVIEAARRSMHPNISLDTLASEIETSSKLIGNSIKILPNNFQLDENLTEQDDLFENNEDKMIKLLESVLTFLNPHKAYTILNKVYTSLLKQLCLKSEVNFKVKFIFHNVSMIERVICDNPLYFKKSSQIYQKNLSLAQTIRKEFVIIENSFGILIPNSEIAYNIEMINIFKNSHNE